MKGLKFLFDSWKKMPLCFWFGIALSLVMAALPLILHDETSAEEYMLSLIHI